MGSRSIPRATATTGRRSRRHRLDQVAEGGGSATACWTRPRAEQALTRSLRLAFASAGAPDSESAWPTAATSASRRARPDLRVSFFAKASGLPRAGDCQPGDGRRIAGVRQYPGERLDTGTGAVTATLRVPAGVSGRPATGSSSASTTAAACGPYRPGRRSGSRWSRCSRRPTGTGRTGCVPTCEPGPGMRPKICRFPGGNYVEGNTVDTRWDWKTTIGPVWERPGHQNTAWGYWSDDGLGLLEYLQLAEDLGAPAGARRLGRLHPQRHVVDRGGLGPYVQDALDQIEYATGPATSTWGARRAADGHPAPFNLPTSRSATRTGSTAARRLRRVPVPGVLRRHQGRVPRDQDHRHHPGRPAAAHGRLDQHYYNRRSPGSSTRRRCSTATTAAARRCSWASTPGPRTRAACRPASSATPSARPRS